ncbi:MAG: DinB family protein, partial [Candidatus Bipolaricaulia bacterium]
MKKTIRQELFAAELLEILEEMFDTHHGVFLDEGTSLFATLESVTAEIASTPMAAGTVSIAAHVEHVIFYLEVLGGHIAGEGVGELDWGEIWERVNWVSKEEWNELRDRLRTTYTGLMETLRAIEDWEQNDAVGASIAIVAHTACHLGAIR